MALLHVENMDDGTLNFKLKGDRFEVAEMIRTIIEARPDVIPVFAAPVLSHFKDHKIDPDVFLRENRL